MMDLRHGKKRKVVTAIVAVILALAMVVPTILGMLVSVFS